jgi:transcriptional regulator of arginine metabolism
MSSSEGKNRLSALKKLLNQGNLSTQSDLQGKLEKLGYFVTQSTISRDLRRLGAVKTVNGEGQTVYRLREGGSATSQTSSLSDLVISITSNGMLIVIHTFPGSASLIARHLDQVRPGGILGTLAGDDTIFVALSSHRSGNVAIQEIEASFKNPN